MNKIAVFPGSFDPITRGHENVIQRAIPLFDHIIIAISVEKYTGLTVEFCRARRAQYIIRGLRTSADFEFERSIGQINKMIHNNIETVFLLSLPEFSSLNSSIVRDIIKHKGNPDRFIPVALR